MPRVTPIVSAAVLLAALAPQASGATVSASWRASVGYSPTYGTVTVNLLASGSGAAVLALESLPRSKPVTITIRSGDCDKIGTVLAKLPVQKTSSGTLRKTLTLSASAAGAVATSPTRIVTMTAGSSTSCASLAWAGPTPTGGVASGTKVVGSAVAPGTYRTRYPEDACYWKRLTGLSGPFGRVSAIGGAGARPPAPGR